MTEGQRGRESVIGRFCETSKFLLMKLSASFQLHVLLFLLTFFRHYLLSFSRVLSFCTKMNPINSSRTTQGRGLMININERDDDRK